jgi:hypothetical protein
MWLPWLGVVLCLLALAWVGLSAFGAKRWADATQTLTARLEAGRVDQKHRGLSPARYDTRELEGLPAPVQRYFRAVLEEGQPLIAAVTLELAGTINLSATGEQWKPFTSTQRVTTRRPGFIWDATVALLPGAAVRVVDSYIAGEGLLRAAVLGHFTVAELHGGGEIARAELMRWFAETAWYPTALLPSQGVQWEAVDDHSANATMVDGPLTLSLLFTFDGAGLIESARAAARSAQVGKETVMLPWEGRWADYRAHDGMMLPSAGEAAWLGPQGRRPYFLGSVTALRVDFAP